jgi:hypothetical protein
MSDINILAFKANQKTEATEKNVLEINEKINLKIWKFLSLEEIKNITQVNRNCNNFYKKDIFWQLKIGEFFPSFVENKNKNNFFNFFFHPNESKKNVFKYLFQNYFVLDFIKESHLPLGYSYNFDVLDKKKTIKCCLIGGKIKNKKKKKNFFKKYYFFRKGDRKKENC